MKTEILDSFESENDSIKSVPKLLVIGMFFFSSISGLSYLLELVLIDVLVNAGCDSVVIFWTAEISILVIIAILTLFLLRALHLNKMVSERRGSLILRNVIIIFIVSQLLQMSYSFFQSEIWLEGYMEQLLSYYDAKRDLGYSAIVESLLAYLRYPIIGLVIWKHK